MDISPLGVPNSTGIASVPTYPSSAASAIDTAGQSASPSLPGLSGSNPDYQVQLSDLGQFSNALASFQDAVGALGSSSLDGFTNAYNQLQTAFSGLGSGLQGNSAVQGLQNQITGTVASYAHIEGSYIGISLTPDGTLNLNAVAFNSTMIDTGGGGGSTSVLGSLADQLGSLLRGYNGPGANALSGSSSSSGTNAQDLTQLAATLEKLLTSMEAFMQLMFQMLLGGGANGGQSGGFSPSDLAAIASMSPNNNSSSSTNSGG